MRIFITGPTGFLGKPLCTALAAHELLVLAREPRKVDFAFPRRVVHGDLFEISSWKAALASFRPEACVHLAWSDLPDYSVANSTKNFSAGLELFQCLLEIRCPRVVVTGTCLEYGKLTGSVSEDRQPMGQNVFAALKFAQRMIGESLFAGSGTSLVWARPFFVYGPGQRPTSLIPTVIRCLKNQVPLEVRTPNALQDFVHVEDVARGLAMLATTAAPGGIYNLGSGRPARIADVVNLIARLLGRPEVYPHDPTLFPSGKQNGDGSFWSNNQRMQQTTGWRPQFSLEEGIQQTLANWRPQP